MRLSAGLLALCLAAPSLAAPPVADDAARDDIVGSAPRLKLALVGLDRTDDAAGAALGVQFGLDGSFSQPLREPSQANDFVSYGLEFGLRGDGQVAFEQSGNPDDYSQGKLFVGVSRISGGEFRFQSQQAARRAKLLQEQAGDDVTEERYQEIQRELDQIMRAAVGPGSDVTAADLNLAAGIESNQSGSIKQYTYGLDVELSAIGWSGLHADRYQDVPLAGKLNVLDYPFALLRVVTQTDREFLPSSVHLPVLRFGIAQVDPQDQDPRTLAGETDAFPRAELEASFKTRLIRSEGREFYAAFDYRLFQELGASDAIKAAGLDRYAYFVGVVGSEAGPFVSYSTGRLPLDAVKDQTYKLGYQFTFGD